MSVSATRMQKHTDGKPHDDEPIDLIRQVERHRNTVRRVREALERKRVPRKIKKGDWFTTIEYIRDELGVELVLNCQSEREDAADQALMISLHYNCLWAVLAGWAETAGYSVNKMPHWEAEESFRFDSVLPTVLTLEDAKARVDDFVAAH